MSRDELVQGYLDGQLSRRVFVRRLVATGVAAATAVKYASMLEAMPAGATVADFYLVAEDFAFAPSPAQLVYGQGITIANHSHTRHRHSLTDASGLHLFDTGPIYVQDQKYVTLPAAGTYAVKCSEPVSSHPGMTGRIKVPLRITPSSGTTSTVFTITWSAPGAPVPEGCVVDLQFKSPGATDWTTRTYTGGKTSTTAPLTRRGTWFFRSRLRRATDNVAIGWSNATKVVVS